MLTARAPSALLLRSLTLSTLVLAGVAGVHAEPPALPPGWIDLSGGEPFAPWQKDHYGWTAGGRAALDAVNPARLALEPGRGVLVSSGEGGDLLTSEHFRDVEFQCEFLIPSGSNSGVKLNALYEIQICDTAAEEKPSGNSCGGVYPRAELEPAYRLLDEGVPPRVNAARPAGQWQKLELRFYSPRFDSAGHKRTNARFERVLLNGELIHERVELRWPTGHAWNTKTEVAEGPLMLQGDHGPVAFRNVGLRRISATDGP